MLPEASSTIIARPAPPVVVAAVGDV